MTLAVEEENFIKIAKIVLDIVPKYLRQLFIAKWNSNYPNKKWQSDAASGSALGAEIGNVSKRYFEKVMAGNEEKWDTTILAYVFLYSGLSLIDKVRDKEWRVGPLPLLISEEIDIIRETRNIFFGHSVQMSCPSFEYTTIVHTFKRVARNIFGAHAEIEIDEFERSPIETQQADELRHKLQEEKIRNEELKHLHEGTNLRICIRISEYRFVLHFCMFMVLSQMLAIIVVLGAIPILTMPLIFQLDDYSYLLKKYILNSTWAIVFLQNTSRSI